MWPVRSRRQELAHKGLETDWHGAAAKCQQRGKALKLEATEFLIKMEQLTGMAHERGVTVTDGEIQQSLKQSKAEYPSETKFREYLASQRRSVSDELFLLRAQPTITKGRGENKRRRQASARQAHRNRTEVERQDKLQRRIDVVQRCKQYTNESNPTPPPSILMEQVAQIATGRCVNRPACGKQ